MAVDIGKYFPRIYDGIKEIDEIVEIENDCFNDAQAELDKCMINQFILTSDEDGIEYREKELGIVANPEKEDLDFRRMRLLNRISMQPPYTTIFLRQRLDEIIGKDQYILTIDYDKYTIYIESVAKNQIYNHEISVTLTMVKPAEMVFVNVPTITSPILINETIGIVKLIWNYRLGTAWNLGQKPFLSYTAEEIIKMATIPSVTTKCRVDISNMLKQGLLKAVINDAVEITNFTAKDISNDGKLTITYSVLPSMGQTIINNIKLKTATDTYFDANIYVPVTQEVIMKHTITIKEG